MNTMTATTTLNIKDVQQCFEKERRAFIRDLETLRQQLIKKDQSATKATTIASQHILQLKREIVSLQQANAIAEKQVQKAQQQYQHTSSLLETALDQHQQDQTKLTQLTETIRTMERKHEEEMAVFKKETASNSKHVYEERKVLRSRIDQLRVKLENERKEWAKVKQPLSEEIEKIRPRVSVLEKEIQESRHREASTFQLKEKIQTEVTQYKRKLTDVTTALQEALRSRCEMKGEYQLKIHSMKDKWREMLRTHQTVKEQLRMLQEDYSGLYRIRELVVEQNERVCQSMRQMKSKHEIALKAKDEELWEWEKRLKRNAEKCGTCLKTPEQRQEQLESQLATVRNQTTLAVQKEMELERWDRFQALNTKYMDTCTHLQVVQRELEICQNEFKYKREKVENLQEKEQKLVEVLANTEKRVKEMDRKLGEERQRHEESKRQIQELMENLSTLTTVTSDQSKQLQELELKRREEVDTMKETIRTLEREKQTVEIEQQNLQQRYEQQIQVFEQMKEDKAKQWNEIMNAQLSANLLIEEQAHTIDNLLTTKSSAVYVSPSKSQTTSQSKSPMKRSTAMSSVSSSPVSHSDSDENARVLVLRRECERLRDEISNASMIFDRERAQLQTEYESKVVELMQEIKRLQQERHKLKKHVQEQAMTIHELTMQEESDDDDQEGSESEEEEAAEIETEEELVVLQDRRQIRRRSSMKTLPASPLEANRWIPTNNTRSRSTARIRSPARFKNMSQDLSAIHGDDVNTTIGLSFLSPT